jgi:Spy/CpxP family protein refolding chaperone
MNTRKTFLVASAVALGLLGHPILSQAYDDDHSPGSGRHCRQSADANEMHDGERLADRLNLTGAQRQSMKAIDDKYQPKLRALRASMSDNRQALTRVDAPDDKVRELAEAQGKTIADMIVMRSHMRSEMDKVLTDEQRQKRDKMFEQHWHHNQQHEGMSPG